MGPDDYHDHVNNNAYTNVAASLAIHWGRYMACMCQRPEREEVSDNDISIAMNLKLPFDNKRRLHYQFDGYDHCKKLFCVTSVYALLAYRDLLCPLSCGFGFAIDVVVCRRHTFLSREYLKNVPTDYIQICHVDVTVVAYFKVTLNSL